MRLDRRAVTAGGLALLVPSRAFASDVRVYIADGDLATGPFGEQEIRKRIKSQAEAARTLVWHQGMADWAMATDVPALAALIASLPAQTPLDFKALILGKWIINDAMLIAGDETQSGGSLIPGWAQMQFNSDKTYTYKAYAQWVNRFFRPVPTPPLQPGQVPVRPPMQLVDNTVTYTLSGSGKYWVEPVDATRFDLVLIGTNKITTNDKPEKPKAIDDKIGFTVIGPDHLLSKKGENFHRRSS